MRDSDKLFKIRTYMKESADTDLRRAGWRLLRAVFKEFKLKMEWEVKLSSAALKQVLTFPPRYFPDDKSARESTEFVRPASLTVLLLKKQEEKHSSRSMGTGAARERRNLTLGFRTGPTRFKFKYRTVKCCQ